MSPSACEYNQFDEFIIPDHGAPHWGFASFNAYFHREIKPERRPLTAPGDSKVIVSANDGTVFQITHKEKRYLLAEKSTLFSERYPRPQPHGGALCR